MSYVSILGKQVVKEFDGFLAYARNRPLGLQPLFCQFVTSLVFPSFKDRRIIRIMFLSTWNIFETLSW